MQKRKYNEEVLTKGDLADLKGLPKKVNLGEQKRRISAQVEAGKAHIEGDESLGKLCVTALRTSGEFKRATQGFHTYPARLHPEAARLLLEALPGKSLGDPFCGGGTLLVEALIQGREVHGSDLNPVATLVATARTALLSSQQLNELEALFDSIHRTACASLDNKKRIFLPSSILKYKDWYKTQCFEELAALFDATRSVESELKPLCQAVFSSLVVKYSLRASDTSNKVVYIARKKGAVVDAYADKAREYLSQLRELQTLVPPGTNPADITLSDARFLRFHNVDTIITSPPYPGTYDYLPLQQLRQAWFDLDMNEDSEIGSRRSFKSKRNAYEGWLKDTDDWMASAANALAIGGKIAIVVGEGIQAGRSLKVAKPTMNAAQRAGLKFVCSASVDRKDPATNQKKIEYILVFEKSSETPKNILPKHDLNESRGLGAKNSDIREIRTFSSREHRAEDSEIRRMRDDHRDDRRMRDDHRDDRRMRDNQRDDRRMRDNQRDDRRMREDQRDDRRMRDNQRDDRRMREDQRDDRRSDRRSRDDHRPETMQAKKTRRFGEAYRERHEKTEDARDSREERPRRRFGDAFRERHQENDTHAGKFSKTTHGKRGVFDPKNADKKEK